MVIATILPPREHCSQDETGAIALCARDFARFSRFKDDITLYGKMTAHPFEDIHYQGIDRRHHKWFLSHNYTFARTCKNLLKQQLPGIIEVHNRTGIFHYLRKQFPSTAVTLHLHNNPHTMPHLSTPQKRSDVLAKADAIYCVSHYIRDCFIEGLEEDLDKVKVIYNGIDTKGTQNIDIPKEPVILFVGRISAEKGALEFVRALTTILPQFPSWKAVIIGAHKHEKNSKLSDYGNEVQSIMNSLGDQAEYLGYLGHEETIRYFRKSAITVVPSLGDEAFGRVAIEAMAAESALITTHRGALKEVAGPSGEAALVVKEEVSIDALADAIRSLITNDILRTQLQQQGAKRVKQLFDIYKTTHELDEARIACYPALASFSTAAISLEATSC